MRGAPLLLGLTLLGLALAGCSGGSGGGKDDEIFGPPPDVESGKGLIRGIVLNPALVPVVGATVELSGQDQTQETDENGAFRFLDLDPGTYFVKVSKPGWTETQQSTEVKADVEEPKVLKILIEQMPGTEPRAFTQKFEGFISCSFGTPVNYGDCNTIDEQHSRIFVDIQDRPLWIQTELVWESTQPAGDWLYVVQGVCPCDNTTPEVGPQRFNETPDATSPYVVRADPAFLAAQDAGGVNAQLVVDVSASGPEPETTNGSGVALNQDFTLYVTYFYNLEPLEGWTFLEDGEYPVAGG